MKPDLQVVLQIDAFADGNEQNKGSGYHKLSQVFRSRLVQFSKDHPDVRILAVSSSPGPIFFLFFTGFLICDEFFRGRTFLEPNSQSHSIRREEASPHRRQGTRFQKVPPAEIDQLWLSLLLPRSNRQRRCLPTCPGPSGSTSLGRIISAGKPLRSCKLPRVVSQAMAKAPPPPPPP